MAAVGADQEFHLSIPVQIGQSRGGEEPLRTVLGPAGQVVQFVVQEVEVAVPGADGDLFDAIPVQVPGHGGRNHRFRGRFEPVALLPTRRGVHSRPAATQEGQEQTENHCIPWGNHCGRSAIIIGNENRAFLFNHVLA